jgi:hypothetical protein
MAISKAVPPCALSAGLRQHPIVLGGAIGRTDDQRFTQPVAQRLQLVQRRGVQFQLAGAAASNLGRREVRPAPEVLRHIPEMTERADGVSHGDIHSSWEYQGMARRPEDGRGLGLA